MIPKTDWGANRARIARVLSETPGKLPSCDGQLLAAILRGIRGILRNIGPPARASGAFVLNVLQPLLLCHDWLNGKTSIVAFLL